jgi:thioester reductase-like protein
VTTESSEPYQYYKRLTATVPTASLAYSFSSPTSRSQDLVWTHTITISIGDWAREHPEQPLIPEDIAWDFSSAMANGYGQSKCIAEQILAKAHAASGLRVDIVRAAQVGGPSSSTAVYKHWLLPGWLYVIIKTNDELGYWPTHVTALEWTPIDALAEGIANITATEPNDNDVKVYNMMHPHPAPWILFLGVLRRRFGLIVQEISFPKWLDMVNPQKFKLYGFLGQ